MMVDAHSDSDGEQRRAAAEEKKNKANELYKGKAFSKAIDMYGEAIALHPENATLWSNRAAARIMRQEFKGAIADCMEAIRIDPTMVKAMVRAAKCQLMLGNTSESLRLYNMASSVSAAAVSPADIKTVNQVANVIALTQTLIDRGDFTRAKDSLARATKLALGGDKMDESILCTHWKLLRGQILCGLGDLDEAGAMASAIMRAERGNVDALYLRGKVFYMQGETPRALAHLQQALTMDPDHQQTKLLLRKVRALESAKEEGNKAFQAQQYADAVRLYTHALTVDPANTATNAKLYSNRATAHAKLDKHEEAIDDCTKALELDPKFYKVLLRRADCYNKLERYEAALQDYRAAQQVQDSADVKSAIRNTERQLRLSKRKDHYKTLGLTRTASEREIKMAYRKMALELHPDKTQGDAVLEARFKEVGEAYTILSDPQRKARFDAGVDDDGSMGGGHGGFSQEDLLRSFFQQNRGGGGFGHGGFHGHHFHEEEYEEDDHGGFYTY
ncbi:hypothetical protein RI367_005206 [Sorochytrium milnesiophthora]